MITTNFPSSCAVSESEQRVAQMLGRADAAYSLSHYFRQAGSSSTPIKIPLPASALSLQQRDLTATSAPGGGYLVAPQTLGVASFIERYNPLAEALVVGGLTGPCLVPVVTAQPTHAWIAEGATLSESQPVIGQASMTPHWLTIFIELSRALSLQSEEAEVVIKNTIAEQFRIALVTAMLGGSGVSGQPRGLANTTGVNTVSGTSFGAAGTRDMTEGILNAGGRLDRVQWFGPPAVWKLLAARETLTGSGRAVWDTDGILSRQATPIAQAPTATLIGVDMGRVVIGIFDGLGAMLSVDPFTSFRTGVVAYRLLVGVDIAVLTPGAVSVASSIT